MTDSSVDSFRNLIEDPSLTDAEIKKYLTWGKGNLEQALNYYFRKKDKESKEKQSKEIKRETRSQGNAFQKMRTASIREKQTQQFIKHVKEEYQLPITKPATKDSKGKKKEKEEQMVDQDYDAQFADVDYIPQLFEKCKEEGKMEESDEYIPEIMKEQDGNMIQNLDGDSLEMNNFEQPMNNLTQFEFKQEQPLKGSSKQKTSPEIFNLKSQKPTKKKLESQFDWIQGQSQFLLGQVILFGFAIKFDNNLDLPEGAHISFRHFIEDDKKKKGFRSKKIEKIMNFRLVHKGSDFGRLKDEQTRIFVPLLVNGIIRMELYSHTIPKRVDYFSNLKVVARIFLLKKAVTEPVVETFQGHSDLIVSIYKPVAEQILALFDRLSLKIVTWPLIKRKSKLKPKSSIIGSTNSTQALQRQPTMKTELEKELQRQQRMRNDPFFKSVQKNLTQMFKIPQKDQNSNTKTTSRTMQIQKPQPKSQVKKKILQLKTLDEDKCIQLIDLYQQDLEPCQPSHIFTSSLYNYQSLALAWMLRRQGQDCTQKDQDVLHPLWTQYSIANERTIFINELTSQMSIKPPFAKSKCLGGILADQMGLGKTVMMAALIASNKNKQRKKRQGATLIVLPLTLLSQWQSQLKLHTKGIKTVVYYSQQRKKYLQSLQKFDVVLTTYGTISHEYSRGFHIAKSGLYRLKWQRIVLDEAHYIKGRIIQTAKAVYELEGQYRWCLTGTPIQNGLADLFSLLHFIRYTPWAEWQCFNKYILKPSEAGEEDVYEVLKTILKRVFLRRTKQSKDPDGKPIVQLPPKSSKVEILQMNQKQRQFYDSIYESSKLKIQELQKLGILEAKYMQVLQILMRLRQICCHPILYKAVHKYSSTFNDFQRDLRNFIKKRTNIQKQSSEQRYFQPLIEGEEEQRVEISGGGNISQSYLKQTLAKIQKHELQNCLICLGQVQDPVITSCLHIFCRVCAIRQIQQCNICSACRNKLSKQDTLPLPMENRFNADLNNNFFPSTKLLALIQHLRRLKPGDKAVVFSQFLGMLDLIQHQLKAQKITYLRMEGSTTHKERTRIVETFQKDPKVQIFIVSLKTAGVGLNLVAANKVFLADPWWNPGVEEQAIERVHRIGQKRSVEVIRLVMDRSIEMRMLQLNTNKKQLSQKVLSHDNNSPSQSRVEKLKYLMSKY